MIPRRTNNWQNNFVWVDYNGYVVVHTDNGGVGFAKEPDMQAELFVPDTAIRTITYKDGGDNPNIMLGKAVTNIKMEVGMARKKGLL